MWPLEKQRKTKQYKISESHFSFQKSKTSLFCTSFSGTKHSKQNQKEKNLEWNGEKDLIWIRVVDKIWRAEKQISIQCSKPWRFSTEMLDVKTNKIYSRSLPCPFTFCNCCFFFKANSTAPVRLCDLILLTIPTRVHRQLFGWPRAG